MRLLVRPCIGQPRDTNDGHQSQRQHRYGTPPARPWDLARLGYGTI
jgi:hypothetical protein